MARILLGVCGGIAAYKSLEFTRLALKAGHSVRVVQTEASTRFVGQASFAGITGAPVLLTEWESDPLRGVFPGDPLPEHAPLSHLALIERADLYLIAPATAQTIAKLAHGNADNLLTAAALACRRPLLVAPAMNNAMYEHAATQANLETLRSRGVTVLAPGVGPLGSPGEFGIGRLPEPPELLAAVEGALAVGGELDGANVLVTAGGTREPIDSVRFVGNRSSGRMGFALAEEAQRRGAKVTVIAANVSIPRAPGIEYIDVGTAAELADACAERFAECDVLLMAAAVADYRPADARAGKIKKDQAGGELNLSLVRTTDVLSSLADRRRPGQLLVGFAAEHGEGALAYGRGKLARKKLDAIVVNDIGGAGIGFESTDNEVWIVTADQERHVPKASKGRIAAAILDAVLSRRSSNDIKVRR
ncbi:bifunctional phosphopantothenoylcysteine decarboxylase/phosphopantothenate--cysteine ligase CoaBC [Solirubrobacter soli]|uniref:bifunctional phosphopantothenoylcysteine decarboxylase/phosphopantothenate--cysteine ligase CoaBC n=1 Tax=Solirubrobacter soli TaxID=363832 RepID=UPI0004036E0F|nr:bifunctional phosphopantothenoylcysteine decarboxylase/phosphopantothenate--cysteine ligase CoaBC [Solirubrobacter soli]